MRLKNRNRGRQRSREMVLEHYHRRGWRGPYKEYESLLTRTIRPTSRVLDVGCGRDFFGAEFLTRITGNVHGVDPAAEPRILDCGAVLGHGTAENLPYEDATFDVIVSHCVMEHLEHPAAAFSEFRRVLRPGGRVVFRTPNKWDYISIASSLAPRRLRGRIIQTVEGREEQDTFPTYYRANSLRQICRIARQAKFQVEVLEYYNHYPYLLMFSPLLCRLGILYDTLITSAKGLNGLQASILGILRKEDRAPGDGTVKVNDIEGRTILCFASGYDAPPTSKHHVMHLLAERNTVLWVNYHASRTPSASGSDLAHMARKLREVAGGVRRVRPNLYTLTPLVVPLPTSRAARRVNQALVISQIRAALARLKRGPLQVWSFTPDVAYVLDHLDAEKVVYYCVDDFASFTGYDREQVLRDEAELCRRADLVVTTSRALQEAKAPLNPNTILVPHGVDYAHFAKAVTNNLPVPEDMRGIPHPILGFFGLIRDWVDLDLLAGVARLRPEWHIVLLGDADSNVNLDGYRAIPNMHFLGRRPYADLPAYCRAFDVGLIPFKINELTKAVNPIKLREYLAAGLPVVSTPLPEVSGYVEHVRPAEGPEEVLHAVEACLTASPAERRRRSQAMAGETWAAKVRTIHKVLADRKPTPRKRPFPTRHMKVIVGLAAGGFGIQALSLAQRCPPGVDVLLAAPDEMWSALTQRHGIPANRLRRLRTHTRQRREGGVLRSAIDVVPGTIGCLRLLMKERPDAVMAVGQRVAIFLLLAARLTGAKTVFVECVTRVTRPSLTGRVVATLGLADRFHVQWPEATRLYRKAIYAGRLV